MSKTYADPAYGSKKVVNMGNKGSIDGTYQSATDVVRNTFMFPCTVTDTNLAVLTGGTDLGADVFFYLGKSAAGTGTVEVIGTYDPLQGTGTHADASVIDASVTETSFSTGDDLVFQAVGTIGHAMIVSPHVSYVENFEASDN